MTSSIDIKATLHLPTKGALASLALLLGTDYGGGVKGAGSVKALACIRHLTRVGEASEQGGGGPSLPAEANGRPMTTLPTPHFPLSPTSGGGGPSLPFPPSPLKAFPAKQRAAVPSLPEDDAEPQQKQQQSTEGNSDGVAHHHRNVPEDGSIKSTNNTESDDDDSDDSDDSDTSDDDDIMIYTGAALKLLRAKDVLSDAETASPPNNFVSSTSTLLAPFMLTCPILVMLSHCVRLGT